MIGIGSNMKIIDIYNDINDGKIVLQPDFQRKLVWNEKHKENFIETILKEMPFPEVYLADGEINHDTMKKERVVVDGQQRLSTIYEYITGSDRLTVKKIKLFKDLTKEEKEKFFYYVVVVRDLGYLKIESIRDIFKRINSVDYALEAIEVNNALYDGEYIKTGKDINSFFDLSDIFKEAEIARMKDLEFILLLMTTMSIGGYFPGNKEVENFIKSYNDEYDKKDEMVKYFEELLKIFKKLVLPIDSIWINSKSCYFTLLSEILFLLKEEQSIKVEVLNEILILLNDKILDNKDAGSDNENVYYEFYQAMYQGTNSKKNREIRGQVLRKEIIKSLE